MAVRSWLSRFLSGKSGEKLASPDSPPLAEAPVGNDVEYCRHRDQGLCDLAGGRVEEAMQALGRAVHLRPDLVEAHLNMGQAFERSGKIEAARRAYRRALELDLTCNEADAALASLPPPPPGRKDFKVGRVLRSATAGNSYKVLEVKKGGFGAVYIVRRQEDGALSVLKTFQARYLWSDEDRERFEREAVTWVMLDRHPNIVTAHWVERIEGFPCLVLEYVPGGDLGQLLQKGPLPVERALELALQFCDGMAYAHEKLGIVHRDVKPSNCLLAEDGTLKVTDFGLARVFGEAQEELLGLSGLGAEVRTQYTTPAGTPQYMAPEQLRPGARLDARTDIYSFGIMLYQMLTGDLPLIGSAARAHIQANAATDELPEDTLRLVLRCVEPDPLKRWADFGEVREKAASAYRAIVCRIPPVPAQSSPLSVTAWNNKGVALNEMGRYEEALACYEQALEMDPRDSSVWLNKGNALVDLDRHEEALACYEQALEMAPRDSSVWLNKGRALGELGRYKEEVICCDRGLEIAPRNSGLWNNKGEALRALGRHEEALACYDRGLEIAPRDSTLWNSKGSALGALGRHEEALACYDRGLDIAPRDSALWNNRG